MQKQRLHRLVRTALLAAVLCILGPIAIPIGVSPVPLTLLSFAICLFACLFPVSECVTAVLIYLSLGLVGLPVFSFGQGGFGMLFRPTGGYLVGYLLLAGIGAYFAQKKKRGLLPIGLLFGTAALYLCGTVWYCAVCGTSFFVGITVCVFPYLPGDLCKILLALLLTPILQKALQRSGNHMM